MNLTSTCKWSCSLYKKKKWIHIRFSKDGYMLTKGKISLNLSTRETFVYDVPFYILAIWWKGMGLCDTTDVSMKWI